MAYYTPRSDEELKRIAEDEYTSTYNTLRQSAQQKTERETLALEQQLAGLGRTYDKQREATAKNYRQAYSTAGNEILRRGMQRSSYGAQRLANINEEGNKAQTDLWEAQTAAEGNINAQITQLEQQLAEALAGYDANQAADIQNRLNALKSEEYERAREYEQYQEQLRLQQQQFEYQQERDRITDEQWEKTYQLNASKASSSGGSRSSGNKNGNGNGNGLGNGDGTGTGLFTDEQLLALYNSLLGNTVQSGIWKGLPTSAVQTNVQPTTSSNASLASKAKKITVKKKT